MKKKNHCSEKIFYMYLYKYFVQECRCPTVRELMRALKFKSPRSIGQYYESLEERKLIRRKYGARNVELLNKHGKKATFIMKNPPNINEIYWSG